LTLLSFRNKCAAAAAGSGGGGGGGGGAGSDDESKFRKSSGKQGCMHLLNILKSCRFYCFSFFTLESPPSKRATPPTAKNNLNKRNLL
jgi:hypothetical protein